MLEVGVCFLQTKRHNGPGQIFGTWLATGATAAMAKSTWQIQEMWCVKPSNQVAPAGKCEVRRVQASICVANPAALAETWRSADLMGRFVGQDVWANIWCAALADMEAVVAMVTLACPGGAAVALVAMWGWIIPLGLFFRATSAGYLPLSCLITVPDVRCRRQLEAV